MRRIKTSDLLEVTLSFVVVKIVKCLDPTATQRFEARALRFAQPGGQRLLSLHEKCRREQDDKNASKVVHYISSKDLLYRITHPLNLPGLKVHNPTNGSWGMVQIQPTQS